MSTLPPDILKRVVRFVDCAVAVAGAYSQVIELERQDDAGSKATDKILADLDAFQSHAELGLGAAVRQTLKGELQHHGTEVISSVVSRVDSWRSRYLGNLEEARGLIAGRRAKLIVSMQAAIEKLVLPLAQNPKDRVIRRVFDGTTYQDEMTTTLVPGLLARLSLSDAEPEVPRRLRTLLGKGAKIEIGTKLSRIRKIEEPAVFSLDDQIVLAAQIESHRAQITMAKKHGAPANMRLELATVSGGAAARGTRPDGEQAVVPQSDAPLVLALLTALLGEGERIANSPARLKSLSLDDTEVEGPAALLAVVERIIEHYRPLIAEIAERSPNAQELAIKLQKADGTREEVWIKRAELGQRLATLSPEMLLRVGIPELFAGGEFVRAVAPAAPQEISGADDGPHSERIVVSPPPPPQPSANPRPAGPRPVVPGLPKPDESSNALAPGVPVPADAEDISLVDLDLLVGEISEAVEGCVEPPKIHSREPS